MLTDLLEKIRNTPRKHRTLLIGIDGVGGSGKTTLAESLKENLPTASIVQLDDFYSPELGSPDRVRVLTQVLIPLEKDMAANYQIFDWRSGSLAEWRVIEPDGVVIIEGVFALHSGFADKYDLRIWVDCSPEVGFQRGTERDRVKDGVDNTDKWLNIWIPKEKEYRESENPKQRADYVFNGED